IRVQQVVARHSRLASDARRDHHQVGTSGLLIAVGTDHPTVEPLDGSRLPLVERLALRNPLGDVHHYDVTCQLLLCNALSGGSTNVAGAYDRDLVDHSFQTAEVRVRKLGQVTRALRSLQRTPIAHPCTYSRPPT